MIVLHHLSHSRGTRIVWLLEELKLDYELQPYERTRDSRRRPRSARCIHWASRR